MQARRQVRLSWEARCIFLHQPLYGKFQMIYLKFFVCIFLNHSVKCQKTYLASTIYWNLLTRETQKASLTQSHVQTYMWIQMPLGNIILYSYMGRSKEWTIDLDSKGVFYNNHACIKRCIVKFESFLHWCILFKQAFIFIIIFTGFVYLREIISWYYCSRQKSNTDSLVSFPSDSYIQ